MKKSLLLLPLLLLAAGCTASRASRVGLCVPSFSGDYLQELSYELRRELDHRGIETVIRDADLKTKRQHEHIENFIQDYQDGKLAALVVVPTDSEKVLPALEKAQEAGVPIFVLSTGLIPNKTVKPIADFGVDDIAAGRMAAKMLMAATQNKKGKVLVVSSSHWEACRARVKGFSDELAAAHCPVQLVPLEIMGTRQEIVDKVFEVLRKDAGAHEFIGIFASVDPAMIASMTARNLNGRESDVRIVGFGGSGISRNAVSDGLIFGTVEHSVPDLAAKAAEAIAEYLEKGTIPEGPVDIPVTAFTAADAKAIHAKQQKKDAETSAKLEQLRKEASCKCRDGQSKCVCKECKCNVKKNGKGKTSAEQSAATDKNTGSSQTKQTKNVLRESLTQTDSPQTEAAKQNAAAQKLENELKKKNAPQEPEVK